MKRTIVLLCVFFLFAATAYGAKKPYSSYNRVESVEVTEDDDGLYVTFLMSKPDTVLDFSPKVEWQGNLCWVEIPETYDKYSKRIFYNWDNKKIRGVGARRLSGPKMAVRVLFYSKTRPNELWSTAQFTNGRLVVTFPKKNPSPAILVEAQKPEVPPEAVEKPEPDTKEEPTESPIDLDAIFAKAGAVKDEPKEKPADDPEAKKEDENVAGAALPLVGIGSDDAIVKNKSPQGPGTAPSMIMTGVKMISALLIVVALILLAAYFAKRLNIAQRLTGTDQKLLRVAATAMIGMKKQVAVLDVAGEFFVVGVTGGTINLIGKVEDPKARERLSMRGLTPTAINTPEQQKSGEDKKILSSGDYKSLPEPDQVADASLDLKKDERGGLIDHVVYDPDDSDIDPDEEIGDLEIDFPADDEESRDDAYNRPEKVEGMPQTQDERFKRMLDIYSQEAVGESSPVEEFATLGSIKERMGKLKKL